jgi:hypothetical protein
MKQQNKWKTRLIYQFHYCRNDTVQFWLLTVKLLQQAQSIRDKMIEFFLLNQTS